MHLSPLFSTSYQFGDCPVVAKLTCTRPALATLSPVANENVITQNAARLRELNARVSETFRDRDQSTAARLEWEKATAAFRDNYSALAFPGGEDSAKSRILAGNPDAIEDALTFLEVRPHFFRSGYMRNDFFRYLKRLHREKPQALSDTQLDRLIAVLETRDQFRAHNADDDS